MRRVAQQEYGCRREDYGVAALQTAARLMHAREKSVADLSGIGLSIFIYFILIALDGKDFVAPGRIKKVVFQKMKVESSRPFTRFST